MSASPKAQFGAGDDAYDGSSSAVTPATFSVTVLRSS